MSQNTIEIDPKIEAQSWDPKTSQNASKWSKTPLKSFKKDGREPGAGLPSSEKFKFPNFESFESFKVFESIWGGANKKDANRIEICSKKA